MKESTSKVGLQVIVLSSVVNIAVWVSAIAVSNDIEVPLTIRFRNWTYQNAHLRILLDSKTGHLKYVIIMQCYIFTHFFFDKIS